jgi:hypothetical protein
LPFPNGSGFPETATTRILGYVAAARHRVLQRRGDGGEIAIPHRLRHRCCELRKSLAGVESFEVRYEKQPVLSVEQLWYPDWTS